MSDLTFCEPPAEPIGLVCVLPPTSQRPVIGELLAPLAKGATAIVAIPVHDPHHGLRWRRAEVPERDYEVVP